MTKQSSISLRRSADRGRTDLGWLKSKHSFSFGGYIDPEFNGYRSLRVINDDLIAPGQGFAEHGHRDMEILSWMVEGELAHRDSAGNSGVIRPGDVQLMSAGRGIRHSEFNGSSTGRARLIQIWIEPGSKGLEPGYQQRSFPSEGRRDRFQLVASNDGKNGSLRIMQDASLSIAEISPGAALSVELVEDSDAPRFGYLYIAYGRIQIAGTELVEGDAIMVESPETHEIRAIEESQVLFFDLA